MKTRNELRHHWSRTTSMMAVVLFASVAVYAQQPPAPDGNVAPPANTMPVRPMSIPPLTGTAAAITASGNSLYVLRGNTLLRLNANTLTAVAQRELPMGSVIRRSSQAPPDPNAPLAPPQGNAGQRAGRRAGQPAPGDPNTAPVPPDGNAPPPDPNGAPPPATGAAPPPPDAQGAPPPDAPGGAQGPGGNRRLRAGRMGNGQDGMVAPPAMGTPSATQAAAITVGGGYVYVLRGNTLYRLTATDLRLVQQNELPMPASPPMGATRQGRAPVPPPTAPDQSAPPPPR